MFPWQRKADAAAGDDRAPLLAAASSSTAFSARSDVEAHATSSDNAPEAAHVGEGGMLAERSWSQAGQHAFSAVYRFAAGAGPSTPAFKYGEFEVSRRTTGLVIVCTIVLLSDANRGLVLPTLPEYVAKFGGNALALAAANSGFSFTRLLAAPVYGWWTDHRSPGEVLLFCAVISCGCNLLYALAASVDVAERGWYGRHAAQLPEVPLILVVFSRCMLGFGASVLGVGRAYVAAQTSAKERTAYVALLCALQFAGFTLMSAFSLLSVKGSASAIVDEHTFPGFVLTALHGASALALLVIPSSLFDPVADEGGGASTAAASPVGASPAAATGAGASPATASPLPSVASPAEVTWSAFAARLFGGVPPVAYTFLVMNFAVRAVLATMETLGTCIYRWLEDGVQICHGGSLAPDDSAVFESALFYTAVGGVGLAMFVLVWHLSRLMEDRALLLLGFGVTALGLGLMIDPHDKQGLAREMPLIRYEAGFMVAWSIGYPLTQTVVVSALSKVLKKSQQGLWMGYLASAGSAGRVVAPVLAGALYKGLYLDTGLIPIASCFGITALCAVLTGVYYANLAPPEAIKPSGGDPQPLSPTPASPGAGAMVSDAVARARAMLGGAFGGASVVSGPPDLLPPDRPPPDRPPNDRPPA